MKRIKIIKPEPIPAPVHSQANINPTIEILKMERTEIKDLASGLGVRARVVTVWALVAAGGNLVSEHVTRREAVQALQQYRAK